MTLTFDLLTLKLVHIIARGVGNFATNLVFLGCFVLNLSANTYQTHHVIDLATLTSDGSLRLSNIQVFVIRLCAKFEGRRPSHLEDIAIT